LDRLLSRTYQDPAHRRFAKHLRHERPYLFTFLYCPGLADATNNLAERVMRILVMIRKNWGGNRSENGARAQAILTSVLCTARQQDKDAFQLLVDLLRSPKPKLLDILPPEIFDANDTKRSQSNDINVGSASIGNHPAPNNTFPCQPVWKCRCLTCNRLQLRKSSPQVDIGEKVLAVTLR
jgi:hypothetical protein